MPPTLDASGRETSSAAADRHALPRDPSAVPRPGGRVLPSVPPAARGVYRALGAATGAAFGAGSRLRGAKVLHPWGTVYEAEVELSGGPPAPAGSFLAEPGRHRAIARFSRSLGLPQELADVLGLAVRLPDLHGPGHHQDLLMVTAAEAPPFRYVFLPGRSYLNGRLLSGLFPFHAGEATVIYGARASEASRRLTRDGMHPDDELRAAAATGELRYDLLVATLTGPFRPIGTLHIGERRPDDDNRIGFNPWNTGGGLRPAWLPNILRDWAYPASQRKWAPSRKRNAAR